MTSDDVAIRVNGVSKAFKLPHEKQSSLKSLFVSMFHGKRTYERQQVLNEISFEIKKGEFFGIVGRNGSGKSTLLKLISQIYTPDEGAIEVNGKLTPFIELGVGFNPELTGRENVFLNGALLGFSREDMTSMYDEIVEFAELEKFMDQKLKNYSSGMQVRLAFSIAIRANTEILVLDEVLAVGDEAFQRKCNEYFKSLKGSGKTVVLVTHSMDAVRKFCDRAVLIRGGQVVIDGLPEDVANQYTEDNFSEIESNEKMNRNIGLSDQVPLFKVIPVSKRVLAAGEEMIFEIKYKITDDTPVHIAFSIRDDSRGGIVMANRSEAIAGHGTHTLKYVFPTDLYSNTDFSVVAVMDEKDTLNRIAFTNETNSCQFAIRNKFVFGSLLQPIGEYHGHWDGVEEFLVDKSGRRMK